MGETRRILWGEALAWTVLVLLAAMLVVTVAG